MATTIQQIINAANATSSANDPGVQATDPELVGVLHRIVGEAYSLAHSENPEFFTKRSADVVYAAGWARPADAINVLLVEAGMKGATGGLESGTLVHVVPFDDREEAAFAPRVYRLGRTYLTVGLPGDPVAAGDGDTLRFWYSHKHPAITAVGQELDPSWPEDHNQLLITKLQKYLALKDKARADLEVIIEEEKRLTAIFLEDVNSADSVLERRHSPLLQATNQEIVSA